MTSLAAHQVLVVYFGPDLIDGVAFAACTQAGASAICTDQPSALQRFVAAQGAGEPGGAAAAASASSSAAVAVRAGRGEGNGGGVTGVAQLLLEEATAAAADAADGEKPSLGSSTALSLELTADGEKSSLGSSIALPLKLLDTAGGAAQEVAPPKYVGGGPFLVWLWLLVASCALEGGL